MIATEARHAADAPAPAPAPVQTRRRLPSGRAVVGAFLVALSATGALALASTGTGAPTSRYVAAAVDLSPGERLEAHHLELVAVDLPPDQRRVSFEHVDDLIGAVALGPLTAGQLVSVSDVAHATGAPNRAQISIPVDAGRALNGRLRPGDLVDVIATFSDGGVARTETISSGAVVVHVATGDGLSGAGSVVVTLAVPPSDLEPLAGAASTGDVFLARTTGVGDGE